MFLHPNLLIPITDYLDFSTLISLLKVNSNVGKRLMNYCKLKNYVRLIYQNTNIFKKFGIEKIDEINERMLNMDNKVILNLKRTRHLTNNDNKDILLTLGAKNGHIEIVKYLLEKGRIKTQ